MPKQNRQARRFPRRRSIVVATLNSIVYKPEIASRPIEIYTTNHVGPERRVRNNGKNTSEYRDATRFLKKVQSPEVNEIMSGNIREVEQYIGQLSVRFSMTREKAIRFMVLAYGLPTARKRGDMEIVYFSVKGERKIGATVMKLSYSPDVPTEVVQGKKHAHLAAKFGGSKIHIVYCPSNKKLYWTALRGPDKEESGMKKLVFRRPRESVQRDPLLNSKYSKN